MANLVLLDVLEAFLDSAGKASESFPQVSVTVVVQGQVISGSLVHPIEYFADMQALVGEGANNMISARFEAMSAKLNNHLQTSHLDSVFLKDVRLVFGQHVEYLPAMEVRRDAIESIALGELAIWH
ncbi:hypothetical protein [Salinibius halmophilus]|uniref:hypothetical protein n=1 Tax=Salinibius halmophilus TaxID=1853216 RepID=UPI000E670971|nr:hypothetical protein [Salinibius halmophilus]